jgi:hypothetical protein
MKRGIRLVALGVAIAVNGTGLLAVNAAMLDGAGRELVSQQQIERIVIIAKRQDLPANQTVASQNCPTPKPL